MDIAFSKKAERAYRKLSLTIKKKTDRKLILLKKDRTSEQLQTKKLQGHTDTYEVRIDYHYRLIYRVETDCINIDAIGPHDEGLGKK